MSSRRLFGPFRLTKRSIQVNLQSDSPGVYALGTTEGDRFSVRYVGRADTDLKATLEHHVPGPYAHFQFAYALTAHDAFERQCHLYHDYVRLDNQHHPCPPDGKEWRCPRCTLARA